jgi:hypothetical protein
MRVIPLIEYIEERYVNKYEAHLKMGIKYNSLITAIRQGNTYIDPVTHEIYTKSRLGVKNGKRNEENTSEI